MYPLQIDQKPHSLGWLVLNRNITHLHYLKSKSTLKIVEMSNIKVTAFDQSARYIILMTYIDLKDE